MPGRIILVRHGETEANRTGCFAESDEIPLTAAGRAQARDAARRLAADFRPRHMLSSPFARARETGEIIARALRLEVEILEGIQERNFGCLKGHPYARMAEMMAGDPACDFDKTWAWRPAGGESLEDVRRRAAAVLDEVRARHGDRDVVVVCHGAVMQAMAAHMTGSWSEAAIPANCGIFVMEYQSAAG
jgi:broad specificity phosphatase PhoE